MEGRPGELQTQLPLLRSGTILPERIIEATASENGDVSGGSRTTARMFFGLLAFDPSIVSSRVASVRPVSAKLANESTA